MLKILKSTFTILATAALFSGATYAAYQDNETSNAVFTGGTLDLRINGNNGALSPVITIGNLKPGDTNSANPFLLNFINDGTVDGTVFLSVIGLTPVDDEGENPEPETNVIAIDHEFSQQLLLNIKDSNDNNVFTSTLRDIDPAFLLPLGSINAGASKVFKVIYELPSTVGNDVMGDSTSFSISATLSQ
ncbi:MAG TPA: TasA family protein [Patescibacteria group bacterium]|nr:TasA family protein [Patescibacteria group bacterium]